MIQFGNSFALLIIQRENSIRNGLADTTSAEKKQWFRPDDTGPKQAGCLNDNTRAIRYEALPIIRDQNGEYALQAYNGQRKTPPFLTGHSLK